MIIKIKIATANALIVIIVSDASKTQVDAQDARKETNFFSVYKCLDFKNYFIYDM